MTSSKYGVNNFKNLHTLKDSCLYNPKSWTTHTARPSFTICQVFLTRTKQCNSSSGQLSYTALFRALPQSTYNRRLAKNTSYLLCVTITILVTVLCICICNDLPKKILLPKNSHPHHYHLYNGSYLLKILILITYQLFIIVTIKSLMVVYLCRQKHSFMNLLHGTKPHPS